MQRYRNIVHIRTEFKNYSFLKVNVRPQKGLLKNAIDCVLAMQYIYIDAIICKLIT
jgi:hypothetical protein